MGCGDYKCSGCKGRKCGHYGGQFCPSKVIVEIPLLDGKTIHIKGDYDEDERCVTKKINGQIYNFYPEQFKEYFKGWFENLPEQERSRNLMANCIYTYSHKEDASNLSINARSGKLVTVDFDCADGLEVTKTVTESILKKCIRADKDLGLPPYTEYLKNQIERTKNEINYYQKRLEQYEKQLEEELKLTGASNT